MFVKAKKILVSEPMYAKSMDEEEAAGVAGRHPRGRGDAGQALGQRAKVAAKA